MLTDLIKEFEVVKTNESLIPSYEKRINRRIARVSPLESPGEWQVTVYDMEHGSEPLFVSSPEKENCIKSLMTALQLGLGKLRS